ncbi:MAG: addiction module protein [Planctomycetaceae bacterium]
MSPSLRSLGLDQLPVEQRIALARELWESIDDEPHPPLLTTPQRRELERRLSDHHAHPEDFVPWDEIKSDALDRFRR